VAGIEEWRVKDTRREVGALQKTITVSSSSAKEIYMVRIVVNNKPYKAPLIYEK
jgi:hypothetical protein